MIQNTSAQDYSYSTESSSMTKKIECASS